ncbi:MAG: InlB B-repeat-containing protein, partial [Clostridia bacterium]|nr:InlB B-repeat-containing protein [Clostridia bacterium]
MKVKKPLPLLILGIVTAICLSLSQIAMVGAEPVDPQAYYDANKQTVSSIDDGDYFADVLDLAKTDDAYVAVMQEIVKVAAAYNAYVDGHKQADYFAKDWDEISHIMDLTLNYVKLSAENYLEYTKVDKHYNRVIDDGNSIDGNYKTIEATYENRRQAAKAEVAAKYDTLFKANKSYPDSSPKTKVGYYDAQGASELDAVKTQYDADVDALVFDAADYQGSVDEVNALTAQAKADMDAVRRNDVERAYDDLQDYYAIAKGTMAGDEDAAKQAAAASAQNGLDFLSGASSEVQREYSNQKKAFNDFFDENEIDDSAYRNRPTISTEDGAITVTAKDSTGAELDVFSAKFVLKADSLVPTDPKRRNAEVEIGKDNSKLSVAYIMDLFILNPVEVWSAPETYEGKAVTYHVTIDLDAFYKNYVEDSSTFFSKMIGLKKHGEDLTEKIDKCAEYLKNNDGSLCYRYSRGDGDGAATALKYSLESGTLTFETGALGTIAITTDEPSSLLLNPVFWLLMIALVILLIIIIIILVKFAKYKIKFYSNGGSDVKPVWARKGEHFVMPENPTREGYVFAGWFEDEELTLRFLETEVTARRGLKAYAKWAEIVAATEEVEEPAPVEAAESVGPTEQQLIDFYAEVRRTALGYALATENEKAVDGMMLVRAYMKKDGVYVYAATDPEAAGVETAEGAIAEDTPA